MQFTENKHVEIMNLLGNGYSVQTICEMAGLSFEQLCELTAQHGDLRDELERWFPKYDFTVHAAQDVKLTQSNTEDKDVVSKGKQTRSGKSKGKSK